MEVGYEVSLPLIRTPDGAAFDDSKNRKRNYALETFIRRTGRRFMVSMQGFNMIVKRIL